MRLAVGSKGIDMKDKKDHYVSAFQGVMLTLNCLAVVLLCVFIYYREDPRGLSCKDIFGQCESNSGRSKI